MERIRALINKLYEQSLQDPDISAINTTVEMLQSELASYQAYAPKAVGTAKVAVVLPASHKRDFRAQNLPSYPSEIKENGHRPLPVSSPPAEKPAGRVDEKPVEIPVEHVKEKPAERPVVQFEERPAEKPVEKVSYRHEEQRKPEQSGWLFDPVEVIPTLAHQDEFKEMNDIFGEYKSSLNDRHKTERKELGSIHMEAPLRDLKKAIGINDRFLFLSELFRGDETMYERSIKTINNFRIHPEAEYWIERELKVKLGWDENKEAVRHFMNLVKRRFL